MTFTKCLEMIEKEGIWKPGASCEIELFAGFHIIRVPCIDNTIPINFDCDLLLQDSISTLCIQETPKQVLWQTVKTHMKCSIMQHFIRSALFAKTKSIFREKNTM